MKFERDDFARIQISLALAIVMIAGGAGVAWLADTRAKAATIEKAAASARRAEFERKLKQVREEENEIKTKAALFSNWRARGIIGEEQRLDWVELIRDIKAARKLIDVQYELSPQQPLGQLAQGGYSFQSSTMKLQMKLLHEGDLLNFINDLRSQAKAYVRVRSCNVVRMPRTAGGSAETALLQADCTLDWVTILPAQGKS